MPRPSSGAAGGSSGEGVQGRETFSEFCRHLVELTAGDLRNWIACAHVDSTSSQARRFLERCRDAGLSAPPCCFVAWEQSAGRGRGDRRWQSDAGLGLYMTFVLPGLAPSSVQQLPMVSGIVVAGALSGMLGKRARLKWPNDVLSGGRKLAGILIEASSQGATRSGAMVGIGINVHHEGEAMPLPGATSLVIEGVAVPDMAVPAIRIAEGLRDWQGATPSMASVVDEYRSWSVHEVGDHLRCRMGGEVIAGEFVGFDDDGSLVLQHDGKVRRLRSGEIVES
jgi:BirA family biotin operon repressor/biotin-[acetyl-CoA-carboxylase] ligase